MIIGVPGSKIKDWLKDKDYLIATNEGEAVGIAAGHYLATKEIPTVFMSSDGFANALNALTTLVIPYEIPINWVIGLRRKLPQHEIMGKTIKKIINLYDQRKGNFTFIE
mgnify:CR=1 FL=1